MAENQDCSHLFFLAIAMPEDAEEKVRIFKRESNVYFMHKLKFRRACLAPATKRFSTRRCCNRVSQPRKCITSEHNAKMRSLRRKFAVVHVFDKLDAGLRKEALKTLHLLLLRHRRATVQQQNFHRAVAETLPPVFVPLAKLDHPHPGGLLNVVILIWVLAATRNSPTRT